MYLKTHILKKPIYQKPGCTFVVGVAVGVDVFVGVVAAGASRPSGVGVSAPLG